jgi:hypothetical protein
VNLPFQVGLGVGAMHLEKGIDNLHLGGLQEAMIRNPGLLRLTPKMAADLFKVMILPVSTDHTRGSIFRTIPCSPAVLSSGDLLKRPVGIRQLVLAPGGRVPFC